MNPLVSIIVPVYNASEFVAETLQSVRNQNFSSWECVIVNDGSNDSSESVIKAFIGDDSRFRYYRQENRGVAAARNLAASLSTGKYLFPLDSDDILMPDFLSKACDFLERHDRYAIYYGLMDRFGARTGVMHIRYKGYFNLLRKNSIHNSALFRKADFDRVGGYDTTLAGLEDWEMYIRMLYRNHRVKFVPEISLKYRIHTGSRNCTTRAFRHALYVEIYRKDREIYRRCLRWLPWRYR